MKIQSTISFVKKKEQLMGYGVTGQRPPAAPHVEMAQEHFQENAILQLQNLLEKIVQEPHN